MQILKGMNAALIGSAVVAVGVIAAPYYVDLFQIMQLTVFAAMAVLALSLGFIWGYGGILCFGQTSFFGLGAYAYAIAAINFSDSTPAIVMAILIPVIFAALLGYFMIYGGVSDVYLGVITLTVSLILFNMVNSTAGDFYKIGNARLGGFNGIPGIPTFNMPGNPDYILSPEQAWTVTGLALIVVYLGLRVLIASTFGRIIIAIRENETRAALLGYDPRFYKLITFMIGGAIAGFAGALYINWGAFVSPTIFALGLSAQIIIWVIIGGRGTLIGPVIGCLLMQWMVTSIGEQQTLDANFILGAILIVFVLLVPKGIAPTLRDLVLARLPAKKSETAPSNERVKA
ncbi:branched-chain amino acid ABC transporter permease [Puniceibacterium sediminis]|uniref:Amino acid/amide ABC transporter membrane protein 2, HAAT family n=1 Tax=Puniceibacterium sediminis TaxID=1608407 RepID=A0A238VIB9_9RHOB|nr:branched-chain amino acid ABC transporter permease [Puniceibacterium sediminis]SNR33239.1 amino acid/amide ABC transporter membrane protein 2, HAAT family [Puniceibacterium sediminis]